MTGDEPTEEQRDEAAIWLAKRTGGSLNAGDAEKLEAWLNEDRRHRLAYDELRVLYARLEEPARRVAAVAPIRRKIRAGLTPRWGWIVPPTTIVAALCLAWWINPAAIQNWQADIVTGQDMVSTVPLPDGSVAQLGADTAIALDFQEGRRRVHLLRGEAFFEVQHGVGGTFTVIANEDEVRDIGTKFNVDLNAERMDVTVSEGSVEVIGGNDGAPVLVSEGHGAAIVDGKVRNVQSADTDLALSWLSGRLVVQGASVEKVVRTLQRHSKSHIVVRGHLAGRRISGTFPLNDVPASLETIASTVGGSTMQVTPLMIVLY
ncbi:FecR domain-containing protein [Brucella pseudogrignonensis]|uniref:FecR family protein n=1 Tax=Brucella pseudogrignonensis TaxID=419475 RepID=UPI001E4E0138|nr:FecR domain-containing protein [Brucella pseudogrignonensis]MCD4512168.1 FecR domain-containing protein [Brucella pseudogrignonensis]